MTFSSSPASSSKESVSLSPTDETSPPSHAHSQRHDEEAQLPLPEERRLEEKEKEHSDPFLVDWDDGEKGNPKNWSTKYKSWITFQLGMLALAASLGSSIISPAETTIATYVGVSDEAAVLCVSLYILGFALGPSIWAPVSEIWGRRVSMLPAMIGLALFSIGTATSKNAASVFVTRFFGGVFGSAPVSNVSAALGDIVSKALSKFRAHPTPTSIGKWF